MKTDKNTFIRIFHWTVVIVVFGVAIAGLFASGSPSNERAKRLDEQRVSQLESISYAIDQYWNQNKSLPATLTELENSRNIFVQSTYDPETGIGYDYAVTGDRTYNLCAVFDAPSRDDVNSAPSGPTSGFWKHSTGETCFPLEVTKTNEPVPMPIR